MGWNFCQVVCLCVHVNTACVCVCLCSTGGVFALMGTLDVDGRGSLHLMSRPVRACVWVRLLKRTSVCNCVSIWRCTFVYVCNWCVLTCAHVDVCAFTCAGWGQKHKESSY